MKNVLKSLWEHKFIAATGVSALIHSTWALGTLFSGMQPSEPLAFAGWLIPAFLIAFALDMGQIATSSEIRHEGLTVSRGLTFFVFAVATYYLQWLYIAHHMPALAIAPGVSEVAKATATYMRDAALWIIPSFLPLSTILYTFSNKKSEVKAAENAPQISISQMSDVQQSESLALPETNGRIIPIEQGYKAVYGDWSKEYPTEASAYRGLAGYISRYGAGSAVVVPSSNGHSKPEGQDGE